MNHRELKRRRRRARAWKKEHDFYMGIDRRLRGKPNGYYMGMDFGFGDQVAIQHFERDPDDPTLMRIIAVLQVPVKYINLTFKLKEEIDVATEMHS